MHAEECLHVTMVTGGVVTSHLVSVCQVWLGNLSPSLEDQKMEGKKKIKNERAD